MTLIASTAMAAPGRLVVGEAGLLEAANGLPRGAGLPLRAIMQAGTSVACLALAAGAALARRHRLALAVVGAWALARVISSLMKAAVDRPRPPGLLDDVVLRQHLPADPGFPSSHAAHAAALAVVAAWAFPRARVPLVVAAVLVGVARLYVGVHLPLDLVGGWSLGLLCGVAAVAAVERWRPRSAGPPDPC